MRLSAAAELEEELPGWNGIDPLSMTDALSNSLDIRGEPRRAGMVYMRKTDRCVNERSRVVKEAMKTSFSPVDGLPHLIETQKHRMGRNYAG